MSNVPTVTKEEIYDALGTGCWTTKRELAETFECHPRTASHRVTDLIKDGVSIINGSKGYRLVVPADINDEDEETVRETARDVEKMMRWMVATVTRQAFAAKPMKKLMTRARKLLPKDKEERMIVRKYLVQLTHLIDWEEADEE